MRNPWVAGVLGCFAVLRRQALVGDAMSHAALPGIALAFMLTGRREPLILLIGAAAAAWLAALLLLAITRTTRIKEDSGLALVLAVFFGVGLVLLSWLQQRPDAAQAGLKSFLFGQAAALVERDIWAMLALGAPALLCVALCWKQFKLISFDPDYAASVGVPVRGMGVLLTTLIVVAIVIGLQTVGVVLMSAMLVAPAAAAYLLTDRLPVMLGLSALIGALSALAGYWVARLLDISPGGAMASMTGVAFLLAYLLAPGRGLLALGLRRARQRWEFAQQMLALHLLNHEGTAEAGEECDPDHLSTHLRWRPTFVKRVVRRAETAGLVQRSGPVLALTDRGRQLAQEASLR